jgi:hypothetical protein
MALAKPSRATYKFVTGNSMCGFGTRLRYDVVPP